MRYQAEDMRLIDERVLECVADKSRVDSVGEVVECCHLDYEDYEVFESISRLLKHGLMSYSAPEDCGLITERGEDYLAGEVSLRD